MPVVAATLFRTRGFNGQSLSQQQVKSQLLDLWNERRCVPWRAALGRVLTTVARLQLSEQREVLLKTLRSCGRSYKANVMISWKPHVIVALGLIGVASSQLEQMMGRSLRRWRPNIAALASKAMEIPFPPPAEDAEHKEERSKSEDVKSSSSSSSSSSDTSSGDENVSAGRAHDSSPASSRADANASAHAPAGPDFASAPASFAAPGSSLPAASSLTPPPLASSIGGEDLASKQGVEVARIVRHRAAAPRQILGLPGRGRLAGGDIRKSYLRLAALIHPDKCPMPEATQAFQILQSAYNKLRR